MRTLPNVRFSMLLCIVAVLGFAAQAAAVPTVSLSAPSNNSQYNPPANITVSASASSSGATITKVEFYANGGLIGTDTTSPYSVAWNNVVAGTYSLTAIAYDSLGAQTTSAARTVTVLSTNAPPTVSLSAPANNALYSTPANITISATAANPEVNGSVTKVDFFQNGVLIATDTTSPYSITWSNAPAGTYTLTAVATDNLGATTTSAARTITVSAANSPPTVSLSAPANNALYFAPVNITISATATDAETNGGVTKVDFLQNGVLIATDTTSPYSITWSNPPAGTYTLTAVATDNLGAITTSAARTITVSATNLPPTVSLTAPADNSVVTAPANITISATAANPETNGSITKVDFYRDGVLIATDTTSPYSITWSNVASGTYVLTAVATDNLGATTTSAARTVIVNAPPAVSIATPANNATFGAPASITITANATDSDGTIASVQLRRGTTTIATLTTAPYTYNWTNVAAGSYALTARATDNRGTVTTSATVNVTVQANVPPTVSLTSPTNNATFGAPATIALAATAADNNGTVTKVDFYRGGTTLIGTATTAPYTFNWTNVAAGSYALTAKATDNSGGVTTSSAVNVTVSSNLAPTISLAANPTTAIAPASTVLTATAADSDGTVTKVEFFQGASLIATVNSPGPYTYTVNSLAAGNYSFTARATDNLSAQTTSTAAAVTVNANQSPTVTLTSPTNNATFTAPATITLTATAADTDGTIANVQLLNGTGVVATLTNPPYTFTLTNVTAGSYVFTAKATDDRGAITTSAAANVTVTGVTTAAVYYIYTDQLNTPRAITNEAATPVWKWDNSDPFGANAANEDPDGDTNKFVFNLRFPGQYFDKETNTHYNMARDYDPSIGRYVESDPIGLAGGLNTYTYVRSNPIKYSDKFGLATCGSGWNDMVVPDNPLGFPFSDCCKNHDNCYDDCRNSPSKFDCDTNFLRCMKNSCNSYTGIANWACQQLAATYFDAVSGSAGASAFQAARKNCKTPDCKK